VSLQLSRTKSSINNFFTSCFYTEEKLDDTFQLRRARLSEVSFDNDEQNGTSSDSHAMQILANIITGSKSKVNQSDNNPSNHEVSERNLHLGVVFSSPRRHKKTKQSSGADILQMSPESRTGSRDVINELENILYEGAARLCNSPPETDFVVYSRNTTRSMHTQNNESLTKVEDFINSLGSEDNDPPIFDGSVAVQTPAMNDHALQTNLSGGCGTILHLACVLDSPFALAVLLLMGADASSCHTAFQRLIIHEAACADSPECLSLLLDLGAQISSQLTSEGSVFGTDENQGKTCKSIETPDDHDQESFQRLMKCDENWVFRGKRSLSYAFTLEKMFDLALTVQSDLISEIDAARALLMEIPLSNSNRLALASSCFVSTKDRNDQRSKYNVGTQYSNADGHGNTPLHWAAFKDATSCVSLLLSQKADPNARAQTSGWTPLHDAAYSDSADSIALLVKAGADVNAKANSGATPLCFAAQEDAPKATRLLLHHGADALVRCCGHSLSQDENYGEAQNFTSRFSGYTPLHYCAHYNAHKAASVLLEYDMKRCQYSMSKSSTPLHEATDLSQKLPIHVAVQRGSSDVLRELLHGGARVDRSESVDDLKYRYLSLRTRQVTSNVQTFDNDIQNTSAVVLRVSQLPRPSSPIQRKSSVVTPVSSPVLLSMVPNHPVDTSKPWNCLSQRSIDECKQLIKEADLNWCPKRHSLFSPVDRLAVVELLRVGKRLEQMETGIFLDLWPLVLSFCGRGWFEVDKTNKMCVKDGRMDDDIMPVLNLDAS